MILHCICRSCAVTSESPSNPGAHEGKQEPFNAIWTEKSYFVHSPFQFMSENMTLADILLNSRSVLGTSAPILIVASSTSPVRHVSVLC
jgi:hypothetical protein